MFTNTRRYRLHLVCMLSLISTAYPSGMREDATGSTPPSYAGAFKRIYDQAAPPIELKPRIEVDSLREAKEKQLREKCTWTPEQKLADQQRASAPKRSFWDRVISACGDSTLTAMLADLTSGVIDAELSTRHLLNLIVD